MDEDFSKLQRELHLPSETNDDVRSPENNIISNSTPSVYRYAWYSTREYIIEQSDGETNCYNIESKHTSLVDIKIIDNPLIEDVTLSYKESGGHLVTLQSFDRNLIDYFKKSDRQMHLEWFLNEKDQNGIVMRHIPNDEGLVLSYNSQVDSKLECSAEYRQLSIAEQNYSIYDSSKRPILAKIWVSFDDIEDEYDSLLSILILGHTEETLVIKRGDDILVDTFSRFHTKEVNGKSWTRWNNYVKNHKMHPGIPLNKNISVNGDGVKYALIYKLINI